MLGNMTTIEIPARGRGYYDRYAAWAKKFIAQKKNKAIAWAIVSAWLDAHGYVLTSENKP